jgi:hypothetical protein
MKRSIKIIFDGGRLVQYRFVRKVKGVERFFNIMFPRNDLINRRTSVAREIVLTRKSYRRELDWIEKH